VLFQISSRARISHLNFQLHNMAVKLRLQRKGRKAAPFYHIVVADSRSPRDGKFIEKIGTYNPLTVPAAIELNRERAFHWISVGAQPTDTVNAILRHKGVLYQKHLQKGVNKGAFNQEKADELLTAWIEQKETHTEKHREATKEAKQKFVAKVDGVAKVKVKPVPPPAEVEEAPVVEEAVEAAAEEVAVEAAPVVEAVAEEVAAPVAEVIEAAAEEVAAPVAEVTEAAAEEVAAPIAEVAEAAAEEVAAPVAEVAEEVAVEVAPVEEAAAEEAAPVAEVAEEAAAEVVEAPAEEKTEE
jgi:small subunit ribosomal protein S16